MDGFHLVTQPEGLPEADVGSVEVTDADMEDPELAAEMAASMGGGE